MQKCIVAAMFDWNDLRHLIAVSRCGSTLAAAKSLGVNQSTVHRRLLELERRIGLSLVKRQPAGYRLSEMGEALINDIMAVTVRTMFSPAPDRVDVTAWELAPQDEPQALRDRRLDSFLTFLGPGGFATPDDVEALESCQQGFSSGGVEWNDISRGMGRGAMANDEEQMREYWRRWQQQMGDAADLGGAR